MTIPLLLTRPVRLALFWSCLTLLLYGLFRSQSPPDLFSHSDKWMHLLAFFALGACARLAFWQWPERWLWPLLLFSGPLLEYAQQWLQPARVFSTVDALANAVGVLLAMVVLGALHKPLQGLLGVAR
jgi:VanZ family protein